MIKVQRPENVRMQAFLAANGIQAVPRWETAGSMKHVWRLYAKGVPWTEELARRLTELGFLDCDGEPLGRFSGNGGMFSVFVRGHEELVNENDCPATSNDLEPANPVQAGVSSIPVTESHDDVMTMMRDRCYDLERRVEALTKALRDVTTCPDYRNISTHEMTYAKVILAQFGCDWEVTK